MLPGVRCFFLFQSLKLSYVLLHARSGSFSLPKRFLLNSPCLCHEILLMYTKAPSMAYNFQWAMTGIYLVLSKENYVFKTFVSYHWHRINCTYFKCTTGQILVYIHNYETVRKGGYQTCPSTLKVPTYLLVILPSYISTSQTPSTTVFSVEMILVCIF